MASARTFAPASGWRQLFAAAGVLAMLLLSAFTAAAHASGPSCINALNASMDMRLSADARHAAAVFVIRYCG